MHYKKWLKIGGTRVFTVSNIKIRVFLAILLLTLVTVKEAFSNEITAINFNGDIIGKVIPDGTVIGLKNDILGNVTADSFIVNSKGKIIGGVVPQGVVIGNDNKLLGKVNNDGTVRLPTGKIIGKTLPNSLVVDDAYNIIGSVLYPGLVYNNEGKTVGRLTGDGIYVSLEGQNIGFISPMGYAYKNIGSGYILEGKLISSKMVVSEKGDFIGSIAPGGKVTDFNTQEIGVVHANGYVYDSNSKIIGKAVTSGYAIGNLGEYLGIITYNGEVVNAGEVIGKLRADGNIADNKGNIIGQYVDIASTATDFKGKYIGRVLPNGKVAKSKEVIGTIGAKQIVYDNKGKAIGQIVQAGPVYDYLGNFIALALRNGTIVSAGGTLMGYINGNKAYDNIGRMIGGTINTAHIVNMNNNNLGLSGIGADFIASNVPYKISPFGYVYSSDNIVIGKTIDDTNLYDEVGELKAKIGVNGNIEGFPIEKGVKLTQGGMIIDEKNEILGYKITPYYSITANGDIWGRLTYNNMITDEEGKVISKIVPEYKAVESTNDVSDTYMPINGYVGKEYIALNFNGNILGYLNNDGVVNDFQNNKLGNVVEGGFVVSNEKTVLGKLIGPETVVNETCEFMGVVTPKGDIRNGRDVILGRALANKQVISDMGEVNGFIPYSGNVIDFDGKKIGTVNIYGQVLDYEQAKSGCIRSDGRLYDADNAFKAAVVVPYPVINYENNIVGRILLSGDVVDLNNKIMGYTLPNGNIVSENGKKVIGMAFKYRFAFDKENNFLGRVNEKAEVISSENTVLAKVNFDGAVMSGRKEIGYALYDVYIYDEDNKAIGYLTKNGNVLSFSGNKIGQADKGFLLNKKYEVIGRGSRDYFIRNRSNEVVGELLLDGNLINNNSVSFGKMKGNGEIRNENGKLLAKAHHLQYYNAKLVKIKEEKKTEEETIKIGNVPVAEKKQEDETSIEDENEEQMNNYGIKAIGIALTPDGDILGRILNNNDVIDQNGNLIGKKTPGGLIVDNEGGLIGVEDDKDTPKGNMFMPVAEAYGKNSQLGAGGGYGPGERYDPNRAAILNAYHRTRRENLTYSKVASNLPYSKESYDGMQTHWDDVSRNISTWRVDMSEMILADKPIPAVLARTIMSGAEQVPVTAIVERNVYAEVGRNIVIPAGSRIMGTMGGLSASGQGGATRVNISWSRLIRPDGSAFKFESAQTGDAQGRAGALGYIDEMILQKYGLPVVTELATSLTGLMISGGSVSSDGNGGSVEDSSAQAASDVRNNFLNNMKNVFDQILADKLKIEPVAYVPAGTRILIYPKVDLWIRTAAREREEAKEEDNAPGPLIDGNEGGKKDTNNGNKTGGSDGGSKIEVYNEDNVSANPSGNYGLLDEEPQQKRKKPPVMPSYTPPPASDASSYTPNSGNESATLF